jgi:hypothetical protein
MTYPVLIGSRALNFWFPKFQIKNETDWDIISSEPIIGSEHHPADFLNNQELANRFASDHVVRFNGYSVKVMNLDGLALIKRSHLWRTLSFQKHITHYHKWLFPFFPKNQDDLVLYHERTNLTKKEFSRGSPSLMKSKQKFFEDAITKIYDHDWLHELVAFKDTPLYLQMLKDPNLVWCEQEKWNQFTQEEKLKCVLEEVYVITLERFLLVPDNKVPQKLAFLKSLEKVCTTLCSGWFRDFALDFYPDLCKMYDQEKLTSVIDRINQIQPEKRKYHVC